MQRYLTNALVGLAFLVTGETVQAEVILNVSNGQLIGAQNVEVNGALFFVSFVEGTCIDIFSGCDDAEEDFTFTTQAAANEASQALLDQVLIDNGDHSFDSVPGLTTGCTNRPPDFDDCDVFTPYGIDNPVALVASIARNFSPASRFEDFVDASSFGKTQDTTSLGFAVYAVWSQTGFHLQIDIKPGNKQNNVNICAQGVLSVAILSTETFDATEEVDPSTVSLAGASVKTVGKDDRPLTQNRDVNKDGITDLVVQFSIEELGLESGDTEAELTGQTFDGKPIEGTGAVNVQQVMCLRKVEGQD